MIWERQKSQEFVICTSTSIPQSDRETERRRDGEIESQRDRETESQRVRDRETDRDRDRQTDRQTDRQADIFMLHGYLFRTLISRVPFKNNLEYFQVWDVVSCATFGEGGEGGFLYFLCVGWDVTFKGAVTVVRKTLVLCVVKRSCVMYHFSPDSERKT